MALAFRIILFLLGVGNFIPGLLALFPSKISESYGVTVTGSNLELLLRHRAVMFAIIGGFMIYTAIMERGYDKAVVLGLISMLSFVLLFYTVGGEINTQLTKVMTLDLVFSAVLLIGFAFFKLWK